MEGQVSIKPSTLRQTLRVTPVRTQSKESEKITTETTKVSVRTVTTTLTSRHYDEKVVNRNKQVTTTKTNSNAVMVLDTPLQTTEKMIAHTSHNSPQQSAAQIREKVQNASASVPPETEMGNMGYNAFQAHAQHEVIDYSHKPSVTWSVQTTSASFPMYSFANKKENAGLKTNAAALGKEMGPAFDGTAIRFSVQSSPSNKDVLTDNYHWVRYGQPQSGVSAMDALSPTVCESSKGNTVCTESREELLEDSVRVPYGNSDCALQEKIERHQYSPQKKNVNSNVIKVQFSNDGRNWVDYPVDTEKNSFLISHQITGTHVNNKETCVDQRDSASPDKVIRPGEAKTGNSSGVSTSHLDLRSIWDFGHVTREKKPKKKITCYRDYLDIL